MNPACFLFRLMAQLPFIPKKTRTGPWSEKVNQMQLHLSMEEQNVKIPIKVKESLVTQNGLCVITESSN